MKKAFTLAEILITLGIIGVVAALTMPSIITHHQKQVTVNKLKKAYSILSQMTVKTYADNGPVSGFIGSGENVNADKTKQFFETYWLPYFNGPVIANPSFYKSDDSRYYVYKTLSGMDFDAGIITSYSWGHILFSTQDGMIYYVLLSGWKNSNLVYLTKTNVYIDINGIKPPNTLGKDVFIFTINFDNNIVQPWCNDLTIEQINNNCSKKVNYGGMCCATKIMRDGWRIADDYPW